MNQPANSRKKIILATIGLVSLISTLPAFGQRIQLDKNWKLWIDKSSFKAPQMDEMWQYSPAPRGISDQDAIAPAHPFGGDATEVRSGQDVFNGRIGFAWFRRDLPGTYGTHHLKPYIIHFQPCDDNATIYVNGVRTFHHDGWSEPFQFPIPKNWHYNGKNVITVLIENTDGPGSIGDVSLLGKPIAPTYKQDLPGFNDSSWTTIHLPNDYDIRGHFAAKNDPGKGGLPRYKGWYRKHFFIPSDDRGQSIRINFEGAFTDAHVWLNGHFLGEHRSGYTGFRFNLTKWIHYGSQNVLAVHLNPNLTEGWWYEGGGIYRHVYLTIANPVHIKPITTYYYSTIKNVTSSSPIATLHSRTTVVNESSRPEKVNVQFKVISPEDTSVAVLTESGLTVPAYSHKRAFGTITFKGAKLWSVNHPNLYTIVAKVTKGHEVLDSLNTPFGFRTLEFNPHTGFYLNGKHVELKGTCNHQDFAGVGIGMPDTVLQWRIRKLKEMGSNAYRCSHNEVAPELLDACDKEGMLVMDENREFGDTYSGKASRSTTTNNLGDLDEEIRTDRNHPCVIMWSLCNEEWAVQGNSDGIRIGTALKNEVLRLDKTRPITAAMNGAHFSNGLGTILDLEGFNYGPGDYPKYHKLHPDHPMFGSETASTVTTRGEYARNNALGYVPAYDTQGSNTAEAAWEPIARDAYMEGGFVWTGFDYKGEPTPFSWPDINSNFGQMDMCGFPKDNYYYYKAWWGHKPIVHIFPNWNWPGKEGQKIDVWAFSNGDSVQLFLNGKSLGTKKMPKYEHVEWHVPYEPGVLKAISYRNGKAIATDVVRTTGKPYALRVSCEPVTLHANGEDCAMIDVAVVDRNGNVVPYASNLIHFVASGAGKIAGVGNGDPSCHEPDVADQRTAFHGLCLGILKAASHTGMAKVTVESAGLKSTSIRFQIHKSNVKQG